MNNIGVNCVKYDCIESKYTTVEALYAGGRYYFTFKNSLARTLSTGISLITYVSYIRIIIIIYVILTWYALQARFLKH